MTIIPLSFEKARSAGTRAHHDSCVLATDFDYFTDSYKRRKIRGQCLPHVPFWVDSTQRSVLWSPYVSSTFLWAWETKLYTLGIISSFWKASVPERHPPKRVGRAAF